MMKTNIIFLLIILFASNRAFSQSCPANIDFEKGDFTNWQCSIGTTSVDSNSENLITLTASAPTAGRHEIISASSSSLDPYGNFPTLCPYGGKYSVKLGNDNTGSEAEGLSYTFTVPVTEDTFSFTYFYAVVFQDPGHLPAEQPRFFVTAYDVLTGDLINCASYNYVSHGSIPGFQRSTFDPSVLYKDWSPTSIQFVGLGNRKVRLEFKTADCTLGGHFGYAYVDVGSGCSNILATAPYCKETNSLILNAPYGFQNYIWYNETYTKVMGTTQSITLSPPPGTSGKFYVDLIPYPGYGCRDTAYALVTPKPVPDTPAAKPGYFYCQQQNAVPLTATPQQGAYLLWYTDTTKTASTLPPIPLTASQGNQIFYVSQKILFGCESFRKQIVVQVDPVPVPSFTINNPAQCQEVNKFSFTSTSANLKNPMYLWDFGDGTKEDSSLTLAVSHSYSTFGSYPVKLTVLNQPVCFKDITQQVRVIPTPIASFSYPSLICQDETPVVLQDQSSVPQQLSVIRDWWWNINGQVIQQQNPAVFIESTAGKIPFKLVVKSAEGCKSDTDNVIVSVRYRPVASFSNSMPLCDNEVLKFTDKSSLSASAAGESITKWFWLFDNNTISTQDPSEFLSSGNHDVQLSVQTNYGCNSTLKDSIITVYPRPHIALNINDSCANRTINYQVYDSLNIVNKWYWNFGDGFDKLNAFIQRIYYKEGYEPLTVFGETIHGCKDTIVRPFTIYDNKAFAGYDTLAAIDQPVLLISHGGANVNYNWSPSVGLNNPSIENPVATLDRDQIYHLDAVTDKGCDSHSQVLIKRYKGPELYIPTGFTPNGDKLNDVLKVFPVGIKKFGFFAVYNRYGQRLFYTEDFHNGWNGFINGVANAGVYVAMAEATDYAGKKLFKKVEVTLLR